MAIVPHHIFAGIFFIGTFFFHLLVFYFQFQVFSGCPAFLCCRRAIFIKRFPLALKLVRHADAYSRPFEQILCAAASGVQGQKWVSRAARGTCRPTLAPAAGEAWVWALGTWHQAAALAALWHCGARHKTQCRAPG